MAHPLAGQPVPAEVKGTLEPPALHVQQAMWDAEARHPVLVSRAEAELGIVFFLDGSMVSRCGLSCVVGSLLSHRLSFFL
eukprot:COSAG02_NODE_21827_length_773_cov_5.290801_1_plen_80_part_00